MNKKFKQRSGFSLIENIIAFAVLTITVLGATNLLSSSIAQSQENTLRLQAYMLAQQGIEATRNIRDSNWMQNLSFDTENGLIWGNGTIYPKTQEVTIAIEPIYDANNVNVSGASWQILPGTNSQLYEGTARSGGTRYSHLQAGERSPFKRSITISKDFDDLKTLTEINESENISENAEKISDNLLLVESTVSYLFRGREKEITLTTVLTDWKEGPL